MKNSSLLFLAALMFLSCSKNDDSSPEENAEFMTATYSDNVNFTSNPDSREFEFNRADLLVGNQLRLRGRQDGANNNFVTIFIEIFNYQGLGTYIVGDVEENKNNMIIAFGAHDSSFYKSNFANSDAPGFIPGKLTITRDDGEIIEGTFSFIGFQTENISIEVKEGKFKIGFGIYPKRQ